MKLSWRKRTAASISLLITSTCTFAFNALPGYAVVEGGAFASDHGASQQIAIASLLGDKYQAQHHNDWTGLVGVGYLLHGWQQANVNLDFGINTFYLANTRAAGTITQAMAYTNLAYQYQVSHTPVYAMAKALMHAPNEKLGLTLDAGIGPNFMRTSEYHDVSLDGVTLPDNAFKGHANVAFSATAGLGLRFNVTAQLPLEVGYRFFYLGQGYLTPRSNQILTKLKTGANYANAIVFSTAIE